MEFGTYSFRGMGSPCELRLYGKNSDEILRVAKIAEAEVARLEKKYSRYREDSLTTLINQRAGKGERTEVDNETTTLLNYAQVAYQQSDQLFDITSGILRKAWDFKSGKLPSQDEISHLIKNIGWDKVEWKPPFFYLPLAEMEVDFGGYVKEYAVDALLVLCQREGIRHGLIDLGGDIAIIGAHPDGQAWQIGIRHPEYPGKAMSIINLKEGCLASSGDYERFIEVDGKKYSHILNPKTGWPVDSLSSVSVLAEQCLVAGTSTTVALLKTKDEAKNWLENLDLPYLIMDKLGNISGNAIKF